MAEKISIEMVDVCYLKSSNAHYGEDTDIGNAMLKLQKQCFQFEKFGIPISNSFLQQLDQTRVDSPIMASLFDSSSLEDTLVCSVDDEVVCDTSYPILGKDTKYEDFYEAIHVRSLYCYDQFDLE